MGDSLFHSASLHIKAKINGDPGKYAHDIPLAIEYSV